jgi:hypothetical protein
VTVVSAPPGSGKTVLLRSWLGAAGLGHLGLAFDYLGEAAMMDLRDLEHNTRDGVHIASLAGTWVALVCGFGGLRRAGDGAFTFAPRLPGSPAAWRGSRSPSPSEDGACGSRSPTAGPGTPWKTANRSRSLTTAM